MVCISLKYICVEKIPLRSFPISNGKPYFALTIKIPKAFPAIIRIAGTKEFLRALLSSFDIIFGQFVKLNCKA